MKNNVPLFMFCVLIVTVGIEFCWRYNNVSPSVTQEVVDNWTTLNYDYLLTYNSIFKEYPDGTSKFDSVAEYKNEQERLRMQNGRIKPYRLITRYKDTLYIDYGTYKEIDSLKCIRFNQMSNKAKYIDSVATYNINLANIKKDELKALNKPCNN